jgi:hypothetical protein
MSTAGSSHPESRSSEVSFIRQFEADIRAFVDLHTETSKPFNDQVRRPDFGFRPMLRHQAQDVYVANLRFA